MKTLKNFKLYNDSTFRHVRWCCNENCLCSETRYLLLLTENYGDLTVLQQKILAMHSAIVIFGSSFPGDQEYTKVGRIKIIHGR